MKNIVKINKFTSFKANHIISYEDISIFKINNKVLFDEFYLEFKRDILNEQLIFDIKNFNLFDKLSIFIFYKKNKKIGFVIFSTSEVFIDKLSIKKSKAMNLKMFYLTNNYNDIFYKKAFFALIKNQARIDKYHLIRFDVNNAQLSKRLYNLGFNKRNDLYELKIPKIKLIWIRHGEVENISKLKHFAKDENLVLSKQYIDKLSELSKTINFDFKIPIFTSPYKRAYQTASYLFNDPNKYNLKACNELKEAFPSQLIGLTLKEAKKKFGNDFWDVWLDRSLDFKNFDFKDIEKKLMLKISEIISLSLPTNLRIIVSHGVLHNIFMLSLFNGDMNYSARGISLDYIAYSEFIYDHINSKIIINKINQSIENNFKEE